MISFKDIEQVVGLLNSTSVDELELKRGSAKLTIRRESGVQGNASLVAPAEKINQQAERQEEGHQTAVCAQQVGFFASRSPTSMNALVQPGDKVVPGQIIALLRIGLLYQPVRANDVGRISEPEVPDDTLVEYGAQLFTLFDS